MYPPSSGPPAPSYPGANPQHPHTGQPAAYPPAMPASAPVHPGPASPPGAPTPPAPGGPPPVRSRAGAIELVIDKVVDFILIFVGLYAAIAVQRYQDASKEKDEYSSLLVDFKRELQANLDQEGSITKDLGAIEDTKPGENLGPMQNTFKGFFAALAEDERVVKCLHEEFAVATEGEPPATSAECHGLYAKFDKAHEDPETSFSFDPAVLTPFYRHEVWQLYLADGVKTFRNKDLAVDIAEVYANARLIEEQIEDIETTYNDAFMKQVGRTAATDLMLAEIVHDEEKHHKLSAADLTLLIHVDEQIKDEHYAALEVEHILELKVERMKKTVLLMRTEIESVRKAIEEELDALGKVRE